MIINVLLTDFELFLGEGFERDPEPLIVVADPIFAQWVFSKEETPKVLSTMWSAVVSGGLERRASSCSEIAAVAEEADAVACADGPQ